MILFWLLLCVLVGALARELFDRFAPGGSAEYATGDKVWLKGHSGFTAERARIEDVSKGAYFVSSGYSNVEPVSFRAGQRRLALRDDQQQD